MFEAEAFCRKYGKCRTTLKSANGVKTAIPGMPAAYDEDSLADLAIANGAKVKFPDVPLLYGHAAGRTSSLVGDRAGEFVLGILEDPAAKPAAGTAAA